MSKSHAFDVLIVDDSMIARRIARKVLESIPQKWTIDEAEDGVDAIRCMDRKSGFDLMFLDIDMPRQNGLEVLQEMRRKMMSKNPRVIVISTMCDAETVRSALDFGAHDFIVKPFTKDTLIAKIKSQISK